LPKESKQSKIAVIHDIKRSTLYSNKNNRVILGEIRLKKKEKIATEMTQQTWQTQMPQNTQKEIKLEEELSPWPPEEEFKVKMLRAKIAISNYFYKRNLTDEERWKHYNKLLEEYKFEKGVHDYHLCDEITCYLIGNKNNLLKIDV
jgi:hypothetical protein